MRAPAGARCASPDHVAILGGAAAQHVDEGRRALAQAHAVAARGLFLSLIVILVVRSGRRRQGPDGAGIEMAEYAWLAQLLADQGIATVRFDKLGTGATGLGPYDADPAALLSGSYDELRVQPVRDALAFLTAQPGIDASRLLLLGHSEGGAVAITVASDPGSAPAPAALMLIEPSYDRILDVVPRQLAVQMDAAVAASAMTPADAATLNNSTMLPPQVDGMAPMADVGAAIAKLLDSK